MRAPEPAPAEPSLRVRAARGTVVNAVFLIGLHSLGLLKGFVIAAFLTRSEYGVWGIALIAVATLTWLKQVGIGDKYVQEEAPDPELAYQRAFTIDALSNLVLLGIALVLLPLLALVYGHWEIVAPGAVLALAVAAQTFKSPVWIFYRQMRYARQRAIEAVDPLVSFVVTVGLAVGGVGYWSLVIGYAAGVLASGVVAVAASPYRLAFRYDRAKLREYVEFSWPIVVAGASALLIPQLSMLVGTWELGLAGAGVIALAGTLSSYTDRIDELVTWTLYPAICRVRDRTDVLFEAFAKSNRLALMFGVPFGVGIALFAGDLVEHVLGDEWDGAVGTLEVFGVLAAAHHVGFNWVAFFSARGETRPMAVTALVVLAAFLAFTVPLTVAEGLAGYAAGMAVVTAVSLAMRGWYLSRLFRGFRILRHAARGVAPTVPAAAVVLLLRAAGDPPVLAELPLFLALTAVATVALERTLLRELAGYLRGRGREPEALTAST
ncbi:MAG: oligosaccharide flippase family protein [Actinomycetota bacterium]|nr:oligosaccharide flippase family protein [Actinomycetota bacterium]